MKTLPLARTQGVLMQDLEKEVLLYDLKINKAYSLNETLTIIYQNCDGKTTFDELRKKYHELKDDLIILSLDKLSENNLLVEKFETNISRRNLIRNATIASVSLPIITMIVAPTAVNAASACFPEGRACTTTAECCDGGQISGDTERQCLAVTGVCQDCIFDGSFGYGDPNAASICCNGLTYDAGSNACVP